MSQSITTLLDAYETAVETDDFSRAAHTLERLTDRYDNGLPDEEARVITALLLRDVSGLGIEASEPLQTYIANATGVEFTRAGFLTAGSIYLSDPAAVDRTQTLDTTRTLREQETALNDAAAAIDGEYDDVTLPAVVDLLTTNLPPAPYLKGESDTLTITVENLGDSPANDVTVTVSQPDGLGVSPTTTDLGTLAAGERTTVDVTLTYATNDEYTLSVDLASGNAGGGTETVRIEISTKEELIASILAGIDDLRDRLRSAESLSKAGVISGLEQLLDGAERTTMLANDFAEHGPVEGANESLGGTKEFFEGIITFLDGLPREADSNIESIPSVSAADYRALTQLAKRLIELVAAAQRAEL
jgi:uncharacterized repeat protein (TIGR01451 family)